MKKLLSLLCLLFRHFWRLNCSFLPDFIQKNLFKICLKNYLFVSISLFGFQWSFFSSRSYWWAQVDSNHRPRAYQARALTCWAMSPFSYQCISSIFSPFFQKLFSSFFGGDDGIRTHDPLLAGQVLSQLSYTPVLGMKNVEWRMKNSEFIRFCTLHSAFFSTVPENWTTCVWFWISVLLNLFEFYEHTSICSRSP